jgi:hypothetical protein
MKIMTETRAKRLLTEEKDDRLAVTGVEIADANGDVRVILSQVDLHQRVSNVWWPMNWSLTV